MKIESGTLCPLLNKSCVKLECAWFIKIRGTDPNSGQDIDEWNCAVAWLPMLSINTANESRKTCAATESFRNEMVKQNEETRILLQETQPHLKLGSAL